MQLTTIKSFVNVWPMSQAKRFATPLILLALLMLTISSNWMMLARFASLTTQNTQVDLPVNDTFWLPSTEQVVSNLNGDNSLDLITSRVEGSFYKLKVTLTGNNKVNSFTLSQPNIIGSKFFTYDVDQDNDNDIIVTSAISNKPLTIWLSDGKGNFKQDKSHCDDSASSDDPEVSEENCYLAESPISSQNERISTENTPTSFIGHRLEKTALILYFSPNNYSTLFSNLITSRGPPNII